MAIPDKIKGMLKEKQHFAAARCVMSNSSLVHHEDFLPIHALSDIRDIIGEHKQV